MTIRSKVRERSYTPTAGSSFSRVTDTVRIYDDAGSAITIPGVSDEIPDAGTAHSDTTNYPGFYVVAASLSQPDAKVIDMAVEYTNELQWLDRSSSSPQDVNREAAGFASVTTLSRVKFVDIWYRHTAADPFNESLYEDGNTGTAMGGSDETYTGNVDAAGEPISWPVIWDEMEVSLTRDLDSDPIDWSVVASCLGKRNDDAFIGAATGKLLFTGCRVVETFNTGLVNYSLTFIAEQFWHLRQRVEKNELGPLTEWVEVDGEKFSHASAVRLYQPFPTADFTGLLTTEELDLIEPKVAE